MANATPAQGADSAAEKRFDLAGEDADQLRHYYSQMLLIRRFEERAGEMYTKAKIGGYCHLNLGEEATIVGLMAALEPSDYIFTNYREHGYILTRGVAPGPVMAELFGKESGVSRGRGGSMHLFDSAAHFMGGYAIVGGQLPLATGAAYALKYQGKPGIVVCQMGDATTNIGAWHESLNLAALWKLPIIYLIVNNGYGMGTAVAEGSAEPDLYKRGCAFRMHGERVDGRDVLAVRDAVLRLRRRAEVEHEPAILEAFSFRFRGHSVIDADRYRDPEEVKQGRAADPVALFAQQLLEAQVVDNGWLKETASRVEREVHEAIDFAEQSPAPRLETLYDHIYATPVSNAPGQVEAEMLAQQLEKEGRYARTDLPPGA
ncbi:MAG: pyruvate dehydrogenase (acetyl-transferring) E1 component subunit alpha [Anaerolineae bacterium]|nr:pyruvate dehydrogenase (acetyl-transferring) E1 component subunit alpha [Anaerolineae bacterium]MCQ3979037.1 pyruvate dehydrogenase (acetyl-transferring) E1 component subunit alpha [Anaerolineae bacterium]